MYRLVNYAFLFLLIFLFVLDADSAVRFRVGIALFAAVSFSFLVFALKWLTLDGARAASIFGTITFGLGGWDIAALILLFFVSSTLLSARSLVVIEEVSQAYSERKRRDGVQVWANGFWVALCIVLASVFDTNLFMLGAAGAIATATADTWATEMGSHRFGSVTFLVTNFTKVKPGTEGGISVPGTLAALSGSLFIAGGSMLLFPISWQMALITIFGAGFLGCMADSYFGATLQRDDLTIFGSDESQFSISLDNNFVNWAATGIGSLAAIILNLLVV